MVQYKRVYICHPYSSDPEGNIAKVKKIVEDIGKETIECFRGTNLDRSNPFFQSIARLLDQYRYYYVPVAAFLALPASMSEGSVTREEAMHFCKGLLEGCDELWIYSRDITDGMKEEIELAIQLEIKIVWMV